MLIRTRVLSVTIGLAVAVSLVTVSADDDKVVIVRDGSVDVYVNNSHLTDKIVDRHKWSKKADVVQIFEDASLTDACKTPVASFPTTPLEFRQVVLRIRDLDNSADLEVTAVNEGFLFKKLKLVMPPDWRFAFQQYRHRMVFGNQNQERKLKLQQVVVTAKNEASTVTTYPASPSTATTLCVIFRDR
jgi:hypothetical protein